KVVASDAGAAHAVGVHETGVAVRGASGVADRTIAVGVGIADASGLADGLAAVAKAALCVVVAAIEASQDPTAEIGAGRLFTAISVGGTWPRAVSGEEVCQTGQIVVAVEVGDTARADLSGAGGCE